MMILSCLRGYQKEMSMGLRAVMREESYSLGECVVDVVRG